MIFAFQQTYGQQSYGSYAQPAAADGSYTQTTPAAAGYTQQQQQYGSSYAQPAAGRLLNRSVDQFCLKLHALTEMRLHLTKSKFGAIGFKYAFVRQCHLHNVLLQSNTVVFCSGYLNQTSNCHELPTDR